jgi:hypothetical protein
MLKEKIESIEKKLGEVFTENHPSNDLIFLFHLIIAFLFYSNYFLLNQPLIASTDVLNVNFPLLFTAKRNFINGDLGLWNPYILSGVSAFGSSNSPLFSPDNWPHFLFPEKYFFLAGTFYSFLKMWLLGVFSYLTFREELQSKKWAFFSSLAYQMSGYMVWATMVYDVLSLFLFFTISLYVIWTAHKRSLHGNFILLTLVLLVNMLSSNISYTTYSMAVVAVCGLYRHYSLARELRGTGRLLTFIAAFATSIWLHLFRLWPVWVETHNSNRGFEFIPDFRDTSVLLLRLINPEFLGICYRSTLATFKSFSPLLDGMHIQWAMPQYFGVLPALLVLWAIISPQTGRINFWTVYVIIATALIAFIEPFETVFKLMNPAYHTLSMQIFLPFGFCVLLGYSAKHLESSENFQLSQKLEVMFIFLIFIIVAYQGVVFLLHPWTQTGEIVLQKMGPSGPFLEKLRLFDFGRVGFPLFLGLLLFGVIYFRERIRSFKYFFGALSIVLAIAFIYLYIFFTRINPTFNSHLRNSLSTLILFLLIFWTVFALIESKSRLHEWRYEIFSLAGLFLLWTVIHPWTDNVRSLPSVEQDLLLAVFGFVRFLFYSFGFYIFLKALHAKKIKPEWLFPLLVAFLLIEQIPAGKIHSHIVINPFYKSSNPYYSNNIRTVDLHAEDERAKMRMSLFQNQLPLDNENYRVSHPNSMLDLPLYRELYKFGNEALSSANIIYRIRSYGGHYNVVSKRYTDFILSMIPDLKEHELGFGFYARIENERFLDLSGVAYDYKSGSNSVSTRPNAVSRLMFFENFQIVPEPDRTLAVLKSGEFHPLKSVVLDSDPGFPSGADPAALGKQLSIVRSGPDSVEAEFVAPKPGIVSFNDSHHTGWQVTVNGQEARLLVGNYNFMAVAVPAGAVRIAFHFKPEYFYKGVKLGLMGAGVFVLTAAGLFIFRKKMGGVDDALNSRVEIL